MFVDFDLDSILSPSVRYYFLASQHNKVFILPIYLLGFFFFNLLLLFTLGPWIYVSTVSSPCLRLSIFKTDSSFHHVILDSIRSILSDSGKLVLRNKMATKIDTSMAPLNLHSTPPSISPKLSKFGIKSGFVIPKNKLSGSLVPVFRTSHKTDSTKNIKEESNSKVQRRTKWGIDMTQHTSIKKGRLLAYQVC